MAKRKIDVIFSLVDDFTSSFNKSIETMTAGTKKAQNAWKGVSKFGDSVAGMGESPDSDRDSAAGWPWSRGSE